MKENIAFIRPESFDNGKDYLFRERNNYGEQRSIKVVTFVDYTPCPAIVIVKFENGSKRRCLREDIYESRIVPKYLINSLEFRSSIVHYTEMLKTTLVMFIHNLRVACSYLVS